MAKSALATDLIRVLAGMPCAAVVDHVDPAAATDAASLIMPPTADGA